MQLRKVDADGLSFEIAEAGRGNERRVLLVHGFTGAKDDFVDAVLPPLSAESTFDEMQRILSRLSKVFGTVREGMDIAATDIELLNEGVLITQNLRRIQDKLPAEQIIQAGETP